MRQPDIWDDFDEPRAHRIVMAILLGSIAALCGIVLYAFAVGMFAS
jgi:hypothetical protein